MVPSRGGCHWRSEGVPVAEVGSEGGPGNPGAPGTGQDRIGTSGRGVGCGRYGSVPGFMGANVAPPRHGGLGHGEWHGPGVGIVCTISVPNWHLGRPAQHERHRRRVPLGYARVRAAGHRGGCKDEGRVLSIREGPTRQLCWPPQCGHHGRCWLLGYARVRAAGRGCCGLPLAVHHRQRARRRRQQPGWHVRERRAPVPGWRRRACCRPLRARTFTLRSGIHKTHSLVVAQFRQAFNHSLFRTKESSSKHHSRGVESRGVGQEWKRAPARHKCRSGMDQTDH